MNDNPSRLNEEELVKQILLSPEELAAARTLPQDERRALYETLYEARQRINALRSNYN